MTQVQIRMLAGMNADTAVTAFNRLLAERPDQRAELVRTFRSDLPDLYARWLDQAVRRADLPSPVVSR